MKLIKQPLALEISDVPVDSESKTLIKHSALLPNTIRCIICGPSNCGKTNVMINLLLHKNGLRFKNIYLFSKTTFQPKYRLLSHILDKVPEVNFYIYNNNDDVLHPDKALPNSVIIFDDVICENQSNIRDYYCMGRHKQIDCFYLSQTYSKVPKQLIRDNANLLVIFKQDDTNLKHIYVEHVNSDMSWGQFKSLCSLIWKQKHQFMVINKDCDMNNGRYRKGFDVFVSLTSN